MAEMWISMGPQHPMTHGLWTLKVKIDGETVVDTEPDLGYIHRGVEKICEAREISLKSQRTVTDFVLCQCEYMVTCLHLRSRRSC